MKFRLFDLLGKPALGARNMRLTVSRSMVAFAFLFVAGFAAVVGVSTFALMKLKVNGPVYREIMLGKELIVDILPPPLFTIEAYVLAQHLNNGMEGISSGKNNSSN